MTTTEIIITTGFASVMAAFVIGWIYFDRKREKNKKDNEQKEEQKPEESPADHEPEPDPKEEQEKEPEPAEPVVDPETPAEHEEPVEEPEKEPSIDDMLEGYVLKFAPYINVSPGSMIYLYLQALLSEALAQFNHKPECRLPYIIAEQNFPNIYNFYGNKGDEQKAFDTLIGWLFALVFAELSPLARTKILKIGYEMGGYDRYSDIYGYQFQYDPNVMRICAGAIYAAMRGRILPDIERMRGEVQGFRYSQDLHTLRSGDRGKVEPNDFFTDFREFMPTAPGPYAIDYNKRPDNTYPGEERDEYKNLMTDRKIHEMVVKSYNLSNGNDLYQDTVQAIADKEADQQHLFGTGKTVGGFHFDPVFGMSTIGMTIDPDSNLAYLVMEVLWAASSSRGILQSATVNPKQYGRLRPGCSWTYEATKNDNSDDRRNVLANFSIEDGDGCPTGYYDHNGNWTHPDQVKSAKDYENLQKRNLWANSYPSGHSSGIMGGAMILMEVFPDKADIILRRANQFAINRTIARYHWTSDTINGRVLGTATNAVCHAASDFEKLIDSI